MSTTMHMRGGFPPAMIKSNLFMKNRPNKNRRHISSISLIMRSAVFRLAFLMFIIIVPICILTLVMSSKAISMAENQVSQDLKEALDLNMNQLDNYLRNLGRRLYTVTRCCSAN